MRWVLVTKRYAIKLARIRISNLGRELTQGTFLEGFRANRQERRRWRESHNDRLCPVLWGDSIGIVLVMPRANPLTDAEYAEVEQRYILEGRFSANRVYQGDMKRENYGTISSKIVRIDYGEPPRN